MGRDGPSLLSAAESTKINKKRSIRLSIDRCEMELTWNKRDTVGPRDGSIGLRHPPSESAGLTPSNNISDAAAMDGQLAGQQLLKGSRLRD